MVSEVKGIMVQSSKSKVIRIDGSQDDVGECKMNTIECGKCYSVNRSTERENVKRKTTIERKDQEDLQSRGEERMLVEENDKPEKKRMKRG